MVGEDGIRGCRRLGSSLASWSARSSATTIWPRWRPVRSICSLLKSGSTPGDESRRSWWLCVSMRCCRMRRSILARITSSACCIWGHRAAANRRRSFMSPSCASGPW